MPHSALRAAPLANYVHEFSPLRDLRNKDIYSGANHVSAGQAVEGVDEARCLAQETADWARKRTK
jgi:hypothetical protein